MFGGDWSAWIILFLLFGLFGNNGWGGFGGFGNGGGAGLQGMATRADINEGFALNGLQTGITAIQQGICDSTYALNNAITGGFNSMERQLADCCCTTQRAIDGVNFNMAKGFCDLGNTMNSNTRDLLENQNTNTRAILDFLTQDKIATLTAENQALKFKASQSEQNAFITANQQAQTAELIRRLGADCPTPAYVVQPPTPVNFPVNGCGQVQFGYGWNNGCGCGCG
jgi:hypothetical protein